MDSCPLGFCRCRKLVGRGVGLPAGVVELCALLDALRDGAQEPVAEWCQVGVAGSGEFPGVPGRRPPVGVVVLLVLVVVSGGVAE
jgi:hypothetical protein